MEVLDVIEQSVSYQKNKMSEIGKRKFEQLWQNSISGNEFVGLAHEHIKDLYAIRDKQQAGYGNAVCVIQSK